MHRKQSRPQASRLHNSNFKPRLNKGRDIPLKDSSNASHVIFVGCLPGTISEKDIQHYFERFGPLHSVTLKRKGKKAGAGYATFKVDSQKQFETIVNQSHMFFGRKITCRPFFQGNEKQEYLKRLSLRRIFIKNIPLHYSDQMLTRIFEQYGEVIRSYSIRDASGKSKGFGFVSFANTRVAQGIVQSGAVPTPEGNLIHCEAYQKNIGKESFHSEGQYKSSLNSAIGFNNVPSRNCKQIIAPTPLIFDSRNKQYGDEYQRWTLMHPKQTNEPNSNFKKNILHLLDYKKEHLNHPFFSTELIAPESSQGNSQFSYQGILHHKNSNVKYPYTVYGQEPSQKLAQYSPSQKSKDDPRSRMYFPRQRTLQFQSANSSSPEKQAPHKNLNNRAFPNLDWGKDSLSDSYKYHFLDISANLNHFSSNLRINRCSPSMDYLINQKIRNQLLKTYQMRIPDNFTKKRRVSGSRKAYFY